MAKATTQYKMCKGSWEGGKLAHVRIPYSEVSEGGGKISKGSIVVIRKREVRDGGREIRRKRFTEIFAKSNRQHRGGDRIKCPDADMLWGIYLCCTISRNSKFYIVVRFEVKSKGRWEGIKNR